MIPLYLEYIVLWIKVKEQIAQMIQRPHYICLYLWGIIESMLHNQSNKNFKVAKLMSNMQILLSNQVIELEELKVLMAFISGNIYVYFNLLIQPVIKILVKNLAH